MTFKFNFKEDIEINLFKAGNDMENCYYEQ